MDSVGCARLLDLGRDRVRFIYSVVDESVEFYKRGYFLDAFYGFDWWPRHFYYRRNPNNRNDRA